MRHLTTIAVCSWLLVGIAQGADPPDPSQLDPKAMQEMMMKLAQPGTQHEGFKKLVGEWDCEVLTFCDPETGQPAETPSRSKAKAKFTLLMDGRFVQQDFAGEFQGMKFNGLSITGYDNAQQKYVGVWIDNMGTGMMQTEGNWDDDSGTLTEIGRFETPIGPMMFKMVSRHVSDDEFQMTMWMLQPDGSEQKNMEITYRRKE